jgi:DNA-binding MarR family transcriptional regulator
MGFSLHAADRSASGQTSSAGWEFLLHCVMGERRFPQTIYRITIEMDTAMPRRVRRTNRPVELRRAERRHRLRTGDYAQLAAFRYALRQFLRFSELAAADAGLTGQHYQTMLVLRACPEGERLSINDLARQLLIKHNSAVGLVDRLAADGLIARQTAAHDRRKVELSLTARGGRLLAKLAAAHRHELQHLGPVLARFFAELAQSEPANARRGF